MLPNLVDQKVKGKILFQLDVQNSLTSALHGSQLHTRKIYPLGRAHVTHFIGWVASSWRRSPKVKIFLLPLSVSKHQPLLLSLYRLHPSSGI